jgi:hypothetical protein
MEKGRAVHQAFNLVGGQYEISRNTNQSLLIYTVSCFTETVARLSARPALQDATVVGQPCKGEDGLTVQPLCTLCLDYALGEIRDEFTRRRYERHLVDCLHCQHEVREYKEIIRCLETPSTVLEREPQRPLKWRKNMLMFPVKQKHSTSLKTTWLRRRLRNVSVSVTIAATLFLTLMHTVHMPHVWEMGDDAWDYVAHHMTSDELHIRHHIHRL